MAISATSWNPFVNLAVLLGVFLLAVEANHCRKVDWWHSFDKRGWSRCSHSTEYLNGIYRNDNKGHNDGLYLIEEGWCCKAPAPNQHQPSHCKIADWWSVLDRSVRSVPPGAQPLTPISYTFYNLRQPFHIPCLELCSPFNCSKCTVFKI